MTRRKTPAKRRVSREHKYLLTRHQTPSLTQRGVWVGWPKTGWTPKQMVPNGVAAVIVLWERTEATPRKSKPKTPKRASKK